MPLASRHKAGVDDKMRTTWDPEGLSKRFRFAATSAENYLQEVARKTHDQETCKAIHDMHLAEFYPCNHLHGRTYLQTRQLLLDER